MGPHPHPMARGANAAHLGPGELPLEAPHGAGFATEGHHGTDGHQRLLRHRGPREATFLTKWAIQDDFGGFTWKIYLKYPEIASFFGMQPAKSGKLGGKNEPR